MASTGSILVGTVGQGIMMSRDDGESWLRVSVRNGMHSDCIVRCLTPDPRRPHNVYAGTDKGLYRSEDGGGTWQFLEDNLAVHLEARPLVTDPAAAGTVYAGFALMPYAELWRAALEGGTLLSRVDRVSLAGGLAFLLLIILLGVLGARWLLRRAARGDLGPSKP